MAAGLGFKTFTTGEVLTAANVNGYLMQGILVFATAAARDSAITSPQEGQACYLKDTDAVLTYSGSTWVAVGGAASFSGVKCKSTVAQTISNNTSTALTWDSEDYDTNTYHSTSSNTSRITIPSGTGGYYAISGYVTSDSQTSGFVELQIAKNGSAIASSTITPSNQLPSISAATVVSLVATDYVELLYKQNSGGNKQAYINSFYGYFTASLLGA